MQISTQLTQMQEEFVRTCFKRYVAGDDKDIVKYSAHSLEELDNDGISETFLEESMISCELVSSHWEQPYTSYKCIFLCETKGFPPFHVVCMLNDFIYVKTAYIVDKKLFKNNRIRRRKKM